MTQLAELAFKGLSLGAVYGLIALGFVVVYKASGVINFAQGSLMLVGAYLAYQGSVAWGLPFPAGVALAVAGAAALGLGVERLVLRRLSGQAAPVVILATIGLSIVLDQVVTAVWGFDQHPLDDPWGARTYRLAGLVVAASDVAALVVAGTVMVALAWFYRRSRLGLALRAAASDQEAAMACGISARMVAGASWVLASATATVAGVLLASGTAAVHPDLGYQALRAFPAVILGGLDSVPGAVAGGLVIGLVEVLTAGYAPTHAPWLGTNVAEVVPYVVMVAVLLARPSGLFGGRAPRRL